MTPDVVPSRNKRPCDVAWVAQAVWMAKYDPLKRYLRRQKRARLDLTFPEIERIIGAMLPKRAHQPQWWTTADPVPLQAEAWGEAGYTARLCGEEKVRFERA